MPLWLGETLKDMRFALRALRMNPGFAAVAVLTLALGIGANSAIFSVVHSVLLRPLPYPEPDRLVLINEYNPDKNVVGTGVPYPDYLVWARQSHIFRETSAYWNVSASDGIVLGGTGSPERIRATIVTHGFFSMLGHQPVLGRGFTPEEEQADGRHAFLVSDGLWRRTFGANPEAIGRKFELDGESFTLVGVLPPGFQFPQRCEVWLSTSALTKRQVNDRVSHPFWVLGRLRAGATIQQARTELESIENQLAKTYADTNANWHARVTPLLDDYVGNARLSLLVLYGAVVFILLIACANVANLWLARGVAREREFAIRATLGAGPLRLIRQTLAESLVVVVISTPISLLLAAWGLDLIVSLSAGSIARIDEFHFNAPILAFTAIITLATTLLVGAAPALQGSLNRQSSLRDGDRSGLSGARSQRLRSTLVISEVSLTLMLLCGAGLMLKSFVAVSRVNPGFAAENLLTMQIALPDLQYPRIDQRTAFLARLLGEIRSLPGVSAVAATNSLPMSGITNWGSFNIAGRPAGDWSHSPSVEFRNISADYFRTMRIPVLRGREFSEAEVVSGAPVAVVNQAMASRFWPGADPLGQRLVTNFQGTPREIIGVVGNVRDFGLDSEGQPEIFVPCRWWNSVSVVVRGASDSGSLVPAVRARLAAMDKNVPLYRVATMEELLGHSSASRRFSLVLLSLFAALALLLAAVGVYGMLSFSVSRRTQEFGVRMALGAEPRDMLWLILKQGMKPVLLGLILGFVGSVAITRLISSMLYGVSPTDPLTFSGVTMLLVVVGIAACYIPARRILRVDPLRALRHD
jgi:putative ABC transport system permease protein